MKQRKERDWLMNNAYAVKPDAPFVATKPLRRTPASKENRDMIRYMDSHDFSFHIDKATGNYTIQVKEKNDI